MNVNVLLFHQFLELDAFGALAVFKNLGFRHAYFSEQGGLIQGACGAQISTNAWQQMQGDILFIPGGAGTRTLVQNRDFLAHLGPLCQSHQYVLSVCTGSALLAAAGVLDGKTATTNLNAFDWVKSLNPNVFFVKQRYCQDGKFFTSAGVSAGIDMALAFTRHLFDEEKAKEMARLIEYLPNEV
ncbi:DJ-1/PfpI family protein [Avibacterium avium]|uniref:DJ-1/PfpI family protein n=1 Tax=Avibacterium avium TaxID=751 RepID=UPI003BF8B8B7